MGMLFLFWLLCFSVGTDKCRNLYYLQCGTSEEHFLTIADIRLAIILCAFVVVTCIVVAGILCYRSRRSKGHTGKT